MTNLGIILAVGFGTYLLRLSFVAAVGHRTMPDWAMVPLRFVAPAVLAALVAPAVLLRDGTFDVGPASNPRAIAALIAILIAWKTKNVAAVIVAGMAVVWLFQALL
ncbi:MAG TPA: AzlD domain-containing protein [Acidimicrobiia bacterium]|nr:AzlD domain-containing protein [Acidimicrobiia bacterium]